MEVNILYDNLSLEGYEKGWGFSCLITNLENKVLFDTGWNGDILLHNLGVAGVNLDEIDKIVLSHAHWDHIGGITHIINNVKADIYIGKSFSNNLKNELRCYSNVIEVSEPVRICENIYSTGELGKNIKEQSLLLETDKGLVIVTGCAHPGLDVIIESSKTFGEIHSIIGGFHDNQNLKLLEDISFIVPCHCTVKKEEILRQYTQSSHECKAGNIFQF
ncbi:MAG: MBL fold metallo-hydrolase [Methanobacteriaceae archaeon]|nr:MBL fold metallo-hydrolase [Methanobacteriaceae archaeon]